MKPATTCPRNILLGNSKGYLTTVPHLDPTTPKDIMGVWQSPSGNFDQQLEVLADKITDYTSLLLNSFSPIMLRGPSFGENYGQP